jgi:hypothetical protein
VLAGRGNFPMTKIILMPLGQECKSK